MIKINGSKMNVQGQIIGMKDQVELADGKKAECLVILVPISTMRVSTPGTKHKADGTEYEVKLDGQIAGTNGLVNFDGFAANVTVMINNKAVSNAMDAFAHSNK